MKIQYIIAGVILALSTNVLAEEIDNNVYMDIKKDASGNIQKPLRLKLKKDKRLSLGRIAGVWGSLDSNDTSDVFYIGKTLEKARIRFSLSTPKDMPLVQLTITASTSKNTSTQKIMSTSDKSTEVWVQLQGKIIMQLASNEAQKTYYAVYVWYPGERLDGISQQDFTALQNGTAPKRPNFVRQLKAKQSTEVK